MRMDYEISRTAIELAQIRDRNRLLIECVLLVVRDYNAIYDCLKAEEQQLFHDHFQRIEKRIVDALSPKVYWQNVSLVNSFVNTCVKDLHQIHVIIVGFKNTATEISDACKKISRISILQPQQGKRVYRVEEYDSIQTQQFNNALSQVKKIYNQTLQALRTMLKRFNVNTNEVREQWLAFLIGVDRQLEVAFKQAALKALIDMKRSITDDTYPLFVSQVNLINGRCMIQPSFENMSQTLNNLMNSAIFLSNAFTPLYWVLKDDIHVVPDEDDFQSDKQLIPTEYEAEKHHFKAFQSQMESDSEINILVGDIKGIISSLENPIQQHVKNWSKYEAIWSTDKPTELKRISQTTRTLKDFEVIITDFCR